MSPLLTVADVAVYTIEPPQGFEALAMAMSERCAITIIDERGTQPSRWPICVTIRIASAYCPA
jgi:hypothetical protein